MLTFNPDAGKCLGASIIYRPRRQDRTTANEKILPTFKSECNNSAENKNIAVRLIKLHQLETR